jgi:hypothetical protein
MPSCRARQTAKAYKAGDLPAASPAGWLILQKTTLCLWIEVSFDAASIIAGLSRVAAIAQFCSRNRLPTKWDYRLARFGREWRVWRKEDW